jgi:hypothetical protein
MHKPLRRTKQPEKIRRRQKLMHKKLVAAAGTFTTSDRVTSFLYELMRDHLPAGVVQEILVNTPPGKQTLSNWWIASYADWVAKELQK